MNKNKDFFYSEIANLCSSKTKEDIALLPQWLPPIAWYFGGSVPLSVFNSQKDIEFLEKNKILICFDSSHIMMCLNAGFLDYKNDIKRLMNLTSHIHISGADGLDGEGTSFNLMSIKEQNIINLCLKQGSTKVIETWQGHLDSFYGFHCSIKDLFNMKN